MIGITGAAGFIGSHLVEHLLRNGHRVRALVHHHSGQTPGYLFPTAPDQLEVVVGDVRDAGIVYDFLTDCDACIHLAAMVSVPFSFEAPASCFETNTTGTLNILEAIRKLGRPRLVFASTAEVFGNRPSVPLDEQAALLPSSPYAGSKAAAESMVYAYSRAFRDVEALVVRPFNTFGPRQSARAVIPVIIQQALVGNTINLGNANTRRDFLFIDDLVRFYEMAVSLTLPAEPVINIGSGIDYSIREIVQLVGELLEKRLEINIDERRLRPGGTDADQLLCNPTKARTLTGWEPRFSIRTGLAKTIEWIRQNQYAEDFIID